MFLFGCSVSSSNGIGSSLGTRGMSAESDGVIKRYTVGLHSSSARLCNIKSELWD